MDRKKMIGIALLTAAIMVGLLSIIRAERLKGALMADPLMRGSLLAETVTVDDFTYLVPPNDIYDTNLTATDIPPISSPSYTSVIAMDAMLSDDQFGVDIEVNGAHYFFPYQLLNWHRVVNTAIDGTYLAVTYDPLTGAAIVYQTQKASREVVSWEFSGSVYNNGMLLKDSHGDLWWQMTGTLVAATHKGMMQQTAGETVAPYPSQSMRWGDWKNTFPNSDVLSSKTGYDRDYTRHPYGNYPNTMQVYFPLNSIDSRVGNAKWLVDGLIVNNEQLALVKPLLQGIGVYATVLGGMPIVAFYDQEYDMTNVFHPVVNGQVLTFTYDFTEQTFTDSETGTTWNATGVATDGELQGTVLELLAAPEYYWFAWAAAYPDTRVAVIDEQQDALIIPAE